MTGIAWLACRALALPWWIVVIVASFAWLAPAGDAINVLLLRRRR